MTAHRPKSTGAAVPVLLLLAACADAPPFLVDYHVWPSDLLRRDAEPFLTGGPYSADPPKLLGDGRFPKFDTLSGFGTTSAITVNFTAPVDLADLVRRHRGVQVSATEFVNAGLPHEPAFARRRWDFSDDAIFLLNVDARCQRVGEEVPLDVGHGYFPTVRTCAAGRCPPADSAAGKLYPDDTRGALNDVLLDWNDEDVNGNGLLDDGEDTDGDGILDTAQLLFSAEELDAVKDAPFAEIRRNPCLSLADGAERDRCLVDHATTFADDGGRSLSLRPLWALEGGCRHVVLVTNRVKDVDGRVAASSLATPYDPRQAEAVSAAMPYLARYGLGGASIAFAWAFTTADVRAPLTALRDGLRREGTLRTIGLAVPEDLLVDDVGGAPAGLGRAGSGACVARSMERLDWAKTLTDEEQCALAADWMHVSHVASGTLRTLTPITNVLGLDGDVTSQGVANELVPWTCVVPKAQRTDCPANPDRPVPGCAPFPVALYVHDLGGSRVDLLEVAGRLAAHGVATCGIDGPAHGYGGDRALFRADYAASGLSSLGAKLGTGRAADVDGDGLADSGAEFLTEDPFAIRNRLVQWVFDHLVLLRELRKHDGVRHALAEPARLVGDFDGDGTPDVGGRNVSYALVGTGLGADVAVIVGALEPSIDGVVAVSPVAGITDTFARSLDPLVREKFLRPLVEPVEGVTTYARNSRDFRDFLHRAQAVLDLVDAAAWAPYLTRFPLATPTDTWSSREGDALGPPTPGATLLVLPSLGDPLAPPDAGLRLALGAGVFGDIVRDSERPAAQGFREVFGPPSTRAAQRQPGYELTGGDREILSWPEAAIAQHAAEGVGRLGRHASDTGLVDVDGLAGNGTLYAANPEPFRIDQPRRVDGATRIAGVRFMSVRSTDRTPHGLVPADPAEAFDVASLFRHLVARWVATLDPSHPAAPERDASPDLDPASRDTKHRIDDRACTACETTNAIAGCTLVTCDLENACADHGAARFDTADPLERTCP